MRISDWSADVCSSDVLAEGARLTTLINNLLDLEKIEAGKMSWDFAPVIPSELLSQAGDATASLHGSKDFHFETDVQPGLPAVRADRGKVVQVLINLLSNSVKFTSDRKSTRLNSSH